MKTPNDERRRRNAIRRVVDEAAGYVRRAEAMARFAEEHKNDCNCDLCQCFGQGSCAGSENWTPEEWRAAMDSV